MNNTQVEARVRKLLNSTHDVPLIYRYAYGPKGFAEIAQKYTERYPKASRTARSSHKVGGDNRKYVSLMARAISRKKAPVQQVVPKKQWNTRCNTPNVAQQQGVDMYLQQLLERGNYKKAEIDGLEMKYNAGSVGNWQREQNINMALDRLHAFERRRRQISGKQKIKMGTSIPIHANSRWQGI